MSDASKSPAGNFIRDFIQADTDSGKYDGRVCTRFPPEPNGYLHIGHAKAICIDFSLAKQFGGSTHLRFDDTNPAVEDVEYVNGIQEDIRWLGYQWDTLFFASDYFEKLYEAAEKLILKGAAYVDSLNEEQIRDYRGDYFKKARPSPYRDRPAQESLDLFRRMRAGEFKEGEHVVRAKIDLTSQNMNLRDPLIYRIRYASHHRTGSKWCIYPLYDFAHPLSDAIEKITHSLCSLEFESHRPLYEWCLRETDSYPSRQIEFARLNLSYTVLSKRKLAEMVQKKVVSGWDDPRMPTLTGLRRLGFTPAAIRNFIDRIGVAKADSVVDVGLLEWAVREDLNKTSPRVMGVLNPLKVVIENFPEGEERHVDAPFLPDDEAAGSRSVPFSRVLYLDRDDFREDPPKDWFRLAPGREVRLRYACFITCKEVIKDAQGEITELRCTWDPESWGATTPDKRVVRGTLHWVSAKHAGQVEVRLYNRLFKVESPGANPDKHFLEDINPESLVVVPKALVEPHVMTLTSQPGAKVQFERLGYFCVDTHSSAQKPVFNRTVTLKDTWAKLEAKQGTAPQAAKGNKPPKEAKAGKSKPPAAPPAEIEIDTFLQVDLRVGVVRAAEIVQEADKLLKLQVDVGEERPRQIFAGLRAHYPDPSALLEQRVIVVANLKPRQMKFGLSEGMVLAAGEGKDPVRVATFLAGDQAPKPGTRIR